MSMELKQLRVGSPWPIMDGYEFRERRSPDAEYVASSQSEDMNKTLVYTYTDI